MVLRYFFVWFFITLSYFSLNFSYLISSDLNTLCNFSVFEGTLPFKMSSSSYHYKIFVIMVVYYYGLSRHSVYIAFLVAGLNSKQIPGFGLSSLGVNGFYNSLLSNNINAVHPVLLYCTFAAMFVFILRILVLKNRPVILFKYILNIPLITSSSLFVSSLFLGMWWAQLEGTWGGWWVWDPSENLLLLGFLFILKIIHFKLVGNFRKITKTSTLLFFFVLVFYSITQLGFIETTHNFVSGNNSRSLVVTILFYTSLGGLLFSIKNYKINLFYSFVEKNFYLLKFTIFTASLVLSGVLYSSIISYKLIYVMFVFIYLFVNGNSTTYLLLYKLHLYNLSLVSVFSRVGLYRTLHHLILLIFLLVFLGRVFTNFWSNLDYGNLGVSVVLDDLRCFYLNDLSDLLFYSKIFPSSDAFTSYSLVESRTFHLKTSYVVNYQATEFSLALVLLFFSLLVLLYAVFSKNCIFFY